MLLREVGYARPGSLAEALELLRSDDGARALAGGQTLINVMKARAGSPDALVDLSRIEELKGIELGGDGTLEIGAMATYTEIMESGEARARPILGEVCAQIADVQVRNRGTIGGNVCTNDPTNHLPPLLVALDAQFMIAGADGDAHRLGGRVLPRRLHDRGADRRAADHDPRPGRTRRRLRRRHARRRRHVHRQRRRVAERRRCESRSAASTPCRSCCSPRRRTPTPCAPRSRARTSIRRPTCTRRASTGPTSPRSLAVRAVNQASENRS